MVRSGKALANPTGQRYRFGWPEASPREPVRRETAWSTCRARIRRAIDDLGLELLGFVLPDEERRARYLRDNPGDPLLRDYAAWEALEKSEPYLFSGMYEFWCRKPLRP